MVSITMSDEKVYDKKAIIAIVSNLDKESLIKILTEPKNALIKQYIKLFEMDNVTLEFEKDALEILARTGQGSLRDTLTLLDQAIIFSKGRVNTTSVVDMLGLIDPKLMDNIFSIILNKGDINQIIKDLENIEGDLIADYKTIPVVFGEKTAKAVISILTSLTLIDRKSVV